MKKRNFINNEIKILLKWNREIKNKELNNPFEKKLLLESIIQNEKEKLDCKLKGQIYKKMKGMR